MPTSKKRKLIQKFDYWTREIRRQFMYFVCWITGGHRWQPWRVKARYNILHERSVHDVRECWCCEKTEYVRLPDDTPAAVEPLHL